MEFEKKDKQAFQIFSEYFTVLQDYSKLAPKTEYEVPDKRFIEYLQNFEQIDYTLNRQIELMHNPINERMEFLNDNHDYIVKIAKRLLEIRKEKERDTEKKQTIEKKPENVKINNAEKPNYRIIGNTPYRNIQDKAYLKYSSVFSKQIENRLNAAGIKFSGKVCGKVTTFTVNRQDLNTV